MQRSISLKYLLMGSSHINRLHHHTHRHRRCLFQSLVFSRNGNHHQSLAHHTLQRTHHHRRTHWLLLTRSNHSHSLHTQFRARNTRCHHLLQLTSISAQKSHTKIPHNHPGPTRTAHSIAPQSASRSRPDSGMVLQFQKHHPQRHPLLLYDSRLHQNTQIHLSSNDRPLLPHHHGSGDDLRHHHSLPSRNFLQ